ncbi:hypothetical protein AXF42_Ash014897 [Apostasia shenzhenica]|uniref:Uncharacterized protein n=1 Tax=Apostasia shenzhenica TaxID=1088818 RepID=A0A2I0ALH0_9ASPA|nr:hypothetical protein AXF42_Ash014897 [Apostasia shenzhenica]
MEVENKELECKYSQTKMSLDKMIEDLKKMQDQPHNHLVNLVKENEKLKKELEAMREELHLRDEELSKSVGQTEMERKKLGDQKAKNALIRRSLESAVMEQKRSDERALNLLKELQREKENSISSILGLERELEAKQKLQLEIEQLRCKIEVMKHMETDEESIKKKMEEMQAELDDKIEEQQYLEKLNSDLLSKQVASNNELQECRKELLKALTSICCSL